MKEDIVGKFIYRVEVDREDRYNKQIDEHLSDILVLQQRRLKRREEDKELEKELGLFVSFLEKVCGSEARIALEGNWDRWVEIHITGGEYDGSSLLFLESLYSSQGSSVALKSRYDQTSGYTAFPLENLESASESVILEMGNLIRKFNADPESSNQAH